jgi:hypothetical protein
MKKIFFCLSILVLTAMMAIGCKTAPPVVDSRMQDELRLADLSHINVNIDESVKTMAASYNLQGGGPVEAEAEGSNAFAAAKGVQNAGPSKATAHQYQSDVDYSTVYEEPRKKRTTVISVAQKDEPCRISSGYESTVIFGEFKDNNKRGGSAVRVQECK